MDRLLEQFMPSLMALKNALPGRQPEVLESNLLLLSAYIKFKNKKNIGGNLKLFTKEKRLEVMHWRSEGRPSTLVFMLMETM